MRILVACEESQTVCKAFREKGHECYSCDIQECSGGHPEWHTQQDVIPLLEGGNFTTMDGKEHYIEKWDMIISHPPCTDLCTSGARHFEKKRADGRQREAIEFFSAFLLCNCPKVVIENPIGIISGEYIKRYFPDLAEKYGLPLKPTQIIQPWMFGDNYAKSTCLWIKGLPPLQPKVTEQPKLEYVEFISKDGKKKRQPKWYFDALKLPAAERAKVRSKTFDGIGKAMAEQWG